MERDILDLLRNALINPKNKIIYLKKLKIKILNFVIFNNRLINKNKMKYKILI